MTRCARCNRRLEYPVKVYGGQPFGDTCARILGLTTPREKSIKVAGRTYRAERVQDGQLALFTEVGTLQT